MSQVPGGPTYVTGALPKGAKAPRVSEDHVYEVFLLSLFFEYIFRQADAPSCEDFNTYLVDTQRLQGLFDVSTLLCSGLATLAHEDTVSTECRLSRYGSFGLLYQ